MTERENQVTLADNLIPVIDNTHDIGSQDFRIRELHATSVYGNLNGNSSTSTKLESPVLINGVDFDGSSNIVVGVDNAPSADRLRVARKINGTLFDGSEDVTLEFLNANTANKLETGARINGTLFDGSEDITVGVENAPSADKLRIGRRINGVLFDGTQDISLYVEESTSDSRLKHNKEQVTEALETIQKLSLLRYDKTKELLKEGDDISDFECVKETGFIAQDVLKIPELAHLVSVREYNEMGDMHFLNYNGIYNYLVQAVQELARKLEVANSRIRHLENLASSE